MTTREDQRMNATGPLYDETTLLFVIVVLALYLASFPGSCAGGGRKTAWYTLFAHAPGSLGNLHTTPQHFVYLNPPQTGGTMVLQ